MITGKIRDVEIDENHNILVSTDYFDGDRLIHEGGTRYSLRPGENQAELEARIDSDVAEHCKALITRSHLKKRNHEAIKGLKQAIVGRSHAHNTVQAQKGDLTFILSKDGTHEQR